MSKSARANGALEALKVPGAWTIGDVRRFGGARAAATHKPQDVLDH